MSITNKSFFTSWSGGKDACLALYRTIQAGGIPKKLFTMLSEDEETSRAHGLPLSLLAEQANALGIPLHTECASWTSYEDKFKQGLDLFKEEGILFGVFGDIDLEGHREWVERICSEENLHAVLPLWQMGRREVVEEFINLGFKAIIVTVNEEALSKDFLGRQLNHQLIAELESLNVDPCGEQGEFHTFVIDGPIFKRPVSFYENGSRSHNGYSFLNLSADNH